LQQFFFILFLSKDLCGKWADLRKILPHGRKSGFSGMMFRVGRLLGIKKIIRSW